MRSTRLGRQIRLANFGDKAGKHGPLAAVRVLVSLRLPKDPNLKLEQLARALGSTKAGILTQVAVVLSRIEPARYYEALAGLSK